MSKIDDFRKVALEMGYDPTEVDSFTQVLPAETPSVNQTTAPDFKDTAKTMGYDPAQVESFANNIDEMGAGVNKVVDMGQTPYTGSAIGAVPQLTQPFGVRNHRYDNISGGVNRGADLAVPEGTPLFAPSGADWVVVDAYSGANGRGMQNDGYGNSVLMKNTKTGETIRMSHLSRVGTQVGDVIKGGTPIGLSGQTGHATGPHVDVEYVDEKGRLSNVLQSPYAHQFMK